MADGTEIPEKFVKRCGEILEEESIQFKWQKGDVAFFDNWALFHGRRPSSAPRKVLVATCK
ncbi:Clavaminate synthase-like protein At3g21360 [Linum perenne]